AAARVGVDAGAGPLVASADRSASAARARAAATAYLADSPGVSGRVVVRGGTVEVRTTSTEPTVFLSLIGVEEVTGEGSATARLFTVGG
ncbi:hypothetical protein, partial [Desertihabitans aurantiacus]|uniref:hypothetical protein n=1 Tax=Desertihabitans aurantiacus TaxID=2282477 RepID=UPI0038BC04B7